MARVLLVEDDLTISMLVSAKLKRSGHKVATAATAVEALGMIEEKGAPDVVVLDIVLPDMDGRDLAVELRRREGMENLSVIFLSARVNPQDVESGRALGATYLTKPVVFSALLHAIEQSVPVKTEW